jgi:tRNA(fMet)-specific endonuclease VapC
MSFLLDTDICSAQLRGNRKVQSKIMLHGGQLAVSTITLGELYVWAFGRGAPPRRLLGLNALLRIMTVLSADDSVARKYGEMQATFIESGRRKPLADLFIAATAIVHGLVLVTHNTRHFQDIPQLQLDDWTA